MSNNVLLGLRLARLCRTGFEICHLSFDFRLYPIICFLSVNFFEANENEGGD